MPIPSSEGRGGGCEYPGMSANPSEEPAVFANESGPDRVTVTGLRYTWLKT